MATSAKDLLEQLRKEQAGKEAKVLLEALRKEQGTPEEPQGNILQRAIAANAKIGKSPLDPLYAGFSQGISFGFVDELAAGLRAAAVSPFSGRSYGEVYRDALEKIRGMQAEQQAGHPVLSTAGEIAGSVLPTSAGSAMLGQLKNIPNWLKLSMLGAGQGALYGAGSAEGGSPTVEDVIAGRQPESRLSGALKGGAVGAVVAPVVSAVAKPVLTGARNAARFVGQKLTDTPTRQAERLAAQALSNDAVGAPELQRYAANPSLVPADLGENVTGLTRAAAAKTGPFRSLARETLQGRQTGQQKRLIDALGVKGAKNFVDGFDDWAVSRLKQSGPLYDQAYASEFNPSGLGELLNRPAVQNAMKEATTKLANEGGQGGNVALFDAVKRSLDDDIGAAMRAGRGDDARILTIIKRKIVDAMDDQVPAYKAARAVYSGEASMRNAAELGLDLFKRGLSHDEARRAVADMTASEFEAFRRGALRGLIDLLEKTPENRNAAQKLIESTAVRDKLRLLFKNDGAFARFVQTASDEAQMSVTRNTVLGGSPTARIQEETKALTGAGEIIRDAVTGNHMGLFSRFLRGLGYGDISKETLQELGNLLLKRQSPEALARLTRPTVPTGAISSTTQALVGGVAGGQAGKAAATNPQTNELFNIAKEKK